MFSHSVCTKRVRLFHDYDCKLTFKLVRFRHAGNGAVIARCSQPEVGWLGWRSAEDEDLIKAISDACTYDRGPKTMMDKDSNVSPSPTSIHSDDYTTAQPSVDMLQKKVVIVT